MKYIHLLSTLLLVLVFACNSSEQLPEPDQINTDIYNNIQEQLISAEAGTTITLPEGTFEFDRPLSLDGIANITIQGAGMAKTILSFRGQKVGAEGLKITADSVVLKDFTIRDTKGDAIKLQDCNGVSIMNVKTTWSGGAKESNGAYGLYPVACNGVLIDGCEASNASDAGIYVGQSNNVIVRNSYAHHNVAGIEIENCVNAEVYGNKAEQNSGGILVFDLPDLPVVNGHTCKVYDNQIVENNHKNFAPEGNIVGIVPPGTGIILLAAKNVEIYNNEIRGHKTIGTAIASYYITERPWKDESYDPFTKDVKVYNNTYDRKKAIPDLSTQFGKLVNLLFPGTSQDILYDGILDDGMNIQENPMNICIQQKQENLKFAMIDAANDFDEVDRNLAVYECDEEL